MSHKSTHPSLFAFLPLFAAFVRSQSFVGGNLASNAPFSLPAEYFSSLTTNANSTQEYAITGYDLLSKASSTDETSDSLSVSGWALNIHLTADVPLSESNDPSVDKSQYFQATQLSVIPPHGDMTTFDTNNWMVCGIVFTGGLVNPENYKNGVVGSGGSCTDLVSDACINQLQVNAVAARNQTAGQTIPRDGAGRCEDLEMPEVCRDYFAGGGGGIAFEIFPINASQPDTGRLPFFAAGSTPVANKDDQPAIQAAQNNVWPVLLAWTHFGSGSNGSLSTAHDSAGWLSCVQAPNTTSEAVANPKDDNGKDSGASSDRGLRKGVGMWAGIVGLGVVGLAAVL